MLPFYKHLKNRIFFHSKNYWEERYRAGNNSGSVSYGQLAEFKADVINTFIEKNNIKAILEFGCGDGNQLSFFNVPEYIGFDISKKSIELCSEKFKNHKNKSFYLYDPEYFFNTTKFIQVDATISLDVIYHLVEDEIYEKYIYDLFSSSKNYVIIYSSNTINQKKNQAKHVKHRKFTELIERKFSNWDLYLEIKNKYPEESKTQKGSFAKFYIYKKRR